MSSQATQTNTSLPTTVTLHEVCPREGLQSQSRVIDTNQKLKFISELAETGLSRIEVTGFFHPVQVPQLADAGEVMKQIAKRNGNGIRYAAHIPNETGFQRAREAGANSVIVCLAASDETARRDADGCNSTQDCMTNKLQRLAAEAKSHGMWVRIFITTAWACPYEGPIPPERIRQICETLIGYGVDEICLVDSLASATPADVDVLLSKVTEVVPKEKLAVHFHDNRGMALSNIRTSLNHGISVIDTAAAGLGGHGRCSYIPRNPVMAATEDVLFMLSGLGIKTGVDIEKVQKAGHNVAHVLGVQPLGRYSLAGPVERIR
ncbi:MAG TPA: hydroxymethylglutaryl-CoA lyase [Bryobacteraceae bacterium]|nr:hydroxymethylglutaryl-CoA lyase [Bryobacteraceae bacterium]